MRLPFVSRERYEELRAAHMDLLEKHHKLLEERQQPTRPQRTPQPPKPARDPMIDGIAADVAATGHDADFSRKEAERIKREAFGA